MAQDAYIMRRVGKMDHHKYLIINDIILSFFSGAKVGVLGLNGSGKSSLLKIMAGEGKNFDDAAIPMLNIRDQRWCSARII